MSEGAESSAPFCRQKPAADVMETLLTASPGQSSNDKPELSRGARTQAHALQHC